MTPGLCGFETVRIYRTKDTTVLALEIPETTFPHHLVNTDVFDNEGRVDIASTTVLGIFQAARNGLYSITERVMGVVGQSDEEDGGGRLGAERGEGVVGWAWGFELRSVDRVPRPLWCFVDQIWAL